MNATKITAPNGRYTIITTREFESKFDGVIDHISTTEAQPFIAANFSEDGKMVGGRTMQTSLRELSLKKAQESGMKIEQVEI